MKRGALLRVWNPSSSWSLIWMLRQNVSIQSLFSFLLIFKYLHRCECLHVRCVPRPVSLLLPLLLPRLVQLWLRPLATSPGMAPLSGLSSTSCAASICSSR